MKADEILSGYESDVDEMMEEEEEEEYEVESILAERIRNGKKEFLIKWVGYDSSYNTWEPEENVDPPQVVDEEAAPVNAMEGSGAKEANDHAAPSQEEIVVKLATEEAAAIEAPVKVPGQEASLVQPLHETERGTDSAPEIGKDAVIDTVEAEVGPTEDLEEKKESSPQTAASDAESEDGEELEEYEVEKILKMRTRKGRTEYLIKWVGYDDGWNTWEPEENMGDCDEVMKEFLTRVKQPKQVKTKKLKTAKPEDRFEKKLGDRGFLDLQ